MVPKIAPCLKHAGRSSVVGFSLDLARKSHVGECLLHGQQVLDSIGCLDHCPTISGLFRKDVLDIMTSLGRKISSEIKTRPWGSLELVWDRSCLFPVGILSACAPLGMLDATPIQGRELYHQPCSRRNEQTAGHVLYLRHTRFTYRCIYFILREQCCCPGRSCVSGGGSFLRSSRRGFLRTLHLL